MSYTVRVRGDASSLIVAEFSCPECGVFEAPYPRSSVPEHESCPTCGADSPFVLSAPATRVKAGEVHRGVSDERPPNALDTRPLAEGMPPHEWRKRNQTKIAKERRDKIRKEL